MGLVISKNWKYRNVEDSAHFPVRSLENLCDVFKGRFPDHVVHDVASENHIVNILEEEFFINFLLEEKF